MNHDVDDIEQGLQSEADMKISERQPITRQPILSRIRNFNISSIGSAFSGPLSAMSSYVTQDITAEPNYKLDPWGHANDLEAGLPYEDCGSHRKAHYDTYHRIETSTPTQTRSSSPLQTQSGRISEVKRLFNNFARFRHAHSGQMPASTSFSSDRDWNGTNRSHVQHNPPPLYAPSVYEWDDGPGTPPLTPDSFEDLNNPSPAIPGDYDHDYKYGCEDEENAMEWDRSRSYCREIKEGKKPERSYDIDILDDRPGIQDLRKINVSQKRPSVAARDDQDEWYGLEYTLELSCRERLPSDTKSAGEHSKSRESWAAIHQGTIHPFFEDEDYYQWKNWHRFLDRQDEQKKHRRGFEFKARSKDLAWFYVDEMRTRDLLYWQKACEVYGVVARDVKERLNVLAKHRPTDKPSFKDPFSPPKKHNLGWYLKRSLSIACLRELCPLPGPEHQVRSHEFNDSRLEEFSIDEDGVLIPD